MAPPLLSANGPDGSTAKPVAAAVEPEPAAGAEPEHCPAEQKLTEIRDMPIAA